MNQIILASHGGMSAGVKSTLELILGEVENVHVVATTRDETEPITTATRRLLDRFDAADAVYILTDVLGGSVNNDMLGLMGDYPGATVLCGMNACLALLLASSEERLSAEELDDILNQARSQIVNCNELLKAAQQDEEDDL